MTKDYNYKIHYPEGYESNDKDYPLLIFLHGAGERGTDLSKLGIHGPPMQIQNGQKFNAIVVAPLCPADVWWELDALDKFFDKIMAENRVDKSRIYLTGLSMGGYGTWKWSCRHPDRFAAIAPICGGGNPEDAHKIKDVPTWAFHGAKDKVVGLEESQNMIDAIKAAGGNPKFTIYPEANHNSWTESYDNPNFYTWLFSQRSNSK